MNWCGMRSKDGSVDKHCVVSQCGSFTIGRMIASGRDYYALWRGKELLGIHGSPDEARSAANNTRAAMESSPRLMESGR